MPSNNGGDGGGTKLVMPSGFTIIVHPLPPYYKDIIDNAIPMPSYPKRRILLAAGDIAYMEYNPPDDDVEYGHEDYELWLKWKSVDEERKVVEEQRKRARIDYLLLYPQYLH